MHCTKFHLGEKSTIPLIWALWLFSSAYASGTLEFFFVSALVTSFTQYVLGKVLALRFGNPGTSLHFVSVLSFAGNSIIDFQWNPEINRERTRCSKSYNWINFLPRFGKVSSLVSFLWQKLCKFDIAQIPSDVRFLFASKYFIIVFFTFNDIRHPLLKWYGHVYHYFTIYLYFSFLPEMFISVSFSVYYEERREMKLTCDRLKVYGWIYT